MKKSIPDNPGTSLVNLNSNEHDDSDLEDIHSLPAQSTPQVQKTPPKNCPPSNIPSPFKLALRWPVLDPKKKKNMKKSFPLAITSAKWPEHHIKIATEKKKKEDEKEERKKLCEELKKAKELKKPKTKRAVRKCRAPTPESRDGSDSKSDTTWVSSEASVDEDEESFDEEEIIAYEVKTGRRKPHSNELSKDYEEGEGEEEEEPETHLISEELNIGHWVIVKFQMSEQKNKIRKFIGQIGAID